MVEVAVNCRFLKKCLQGTCFYFFWRSYSMTFFPLKDWTHHLCHATSSAIAKKIKKVKPTSFAALEANRMYYATRQCSSAAYQV
jgi:hypothetical protein